MTHEESGYRATKARVLVTELLEVSDECFTVEELHTQLRERGTRIGLATVYRTVKLLTETGAVERIDAGDGVARFESAPRTPADHHHHLICRSCHRVQKYAQFSAEELELMKKSERRLEERFGYRITGHRIYFEGICAECQSKA